MQGLEATLFFEPSFSKESSLDWLILFSPRRHYDACGRTCGATCVPAFVEALHTISSSNS